jgi:Fur family ferric uptake transcriptional regulator
VDDSGAGHLKLADRLREAGLRVTQPRLLVLGLLEEGGHLSVDDVARRLGQRGTPLQRGSVYHVLRDLLGAELVMEAGAGAGPSRFEVAGEFHHHFVCESCGTLADVPCQAESTPCIDRSDLPGEARLALVTFRGVCTACAAAG